MKKVIPALIMVIILAVAGGVYYVLSNLDALVEAAIEKHGSAATQTAVLVDGVKIDLANGAGAISGLTVANPDGYEMPLAFSLGEVRAGIDLESLQEEPYVIDEITVLAPQVFVEINESNNTNLHQLKKNLTAGSTSQDKQAQAPAEGSAKEPRLIIRRVTFADGTIQARAAALQNKEYELKLPSLDMSNLGGSKGATGAELASEILNRLTDRAIDVVKKDIIDAELDKLKDKARAKVDAEKARLEQKVDSRKEEEKQKAQDKLKDMFSR